MHICLFHDSKLPPLHYGGIERIVVTLAEQYRRRGHQVSVLCRRGSRLKDIEVIELPESMASRANIEDLLPASIDFIHAHQPLSVEPTRPYLVTIHGNGHPQEKYLANTNFLSRSHAQNHGSSIFVFNGIDTVRYPFSPIKEDYYLFLARTTWRVKNLKTAIHWATDLNVTLKIIGGKGLSRRNIEYLGFVDDQQKSTILGKAKALIYPTNWDEPCAGAPLEALACGTPVIATKNGCMPEMVDDETGVLCETYEDLLKAPSKIAKISPQKCREKAETVFSLERMAEDYLKLMEKITRQGRLVDESHRPRYNFQKASVQYMYKPTFLNHLRLNLLGKI